MKESTLFFVAPPNRKSVRGHMLTVQREVEHYISIAFNGDSNKTEMRFVVGSLWP